MSNERKVGSHRVVALRDDVLLNYLAGNPTEPDMKALVDAYVELAAGRPIFLIVDLSEVDNINPGARKVISESFKRIEFRGTAMFGASFQMKVVAKLINSALGLFQKSKYPQEFFDSLDEALAWVDQLRAKARGGAAR
jgi:hypothetical protein